MGTLAPGATLIYERVGDTVYVRESGSTVRHTVGYDWTAQVEKDQAESEVWKEIRHAALTNPALQEALDRVKIIYNLRKQHGQ